MDQNIFNWIQFALKLAPLIIQLIPIIESMLPAQSGPEKLNLLKSVVFSATPENDKINRLAVGEFVENVAASTVATMNRTGAFSHTA